MVGNKTPIARERNRERARARKMVHGHIGTDVFLAAQNWMCPICERSLHEEAPDHKNPGDSSVSVDHVYDLANSKRHAGNVLLAHAICNMNKRDRHPTRGEQMMLGLVNRCLGYRKGVYKAARVGKGMKKDNIPEADFYQFCLEIIDFVKMKVFCR